MDFFNKKEEKPAGPDPLFAGMSMDACGVIIDFWRHDMCCASVLG